MVPGESHFFEIVVMLAAAVCSVAALKSLRLSTVIGYLAAGSLIGPYALDLVMPTDTTEAIAEFGIIFLLFTIGLELNLSRLMQLRTQVFGFGTLQMILTTTVIAMAAHGFGFDLLASLLIGGGLAMSSTAIVFQVMGEWGMRSSQAGRLALSTLILQDLMVIPLLVMVPMFAAGTQILSMDLAEAALKGLAILVLIILVGRAAIRPVFSKVARIGNDELLTATILLTVLGMAWGCQAAGLSPELGAFIAGLLVAETEFHLQVEADITPFRGMLLGLFFMVVGMGINLEVLAQDFVIVLALTFSLVIGKTIIITLLGRAFGFSTFNSLHTGLLLSQGGEFAFVLFRLAQSERIISASTTDIILVSVALSMTITPLLMMLVDWARKRTFTQDGEKTASGIAVQSRDLRGHVVISGFGRVGSALSQLLELERIPYLGLDTDSDIVSTARLNGKPAHYGDASRRLVLRAVGLERARAVVITHSDIQISLRTIAAVREINADIPIIARGKDYRDVRWLEQAGATLAIAEMFETSLQLGGALLRELGISDYEIGRIQDAFRAEDYTLMRT